MVINKKKDFNMNRIIKNTTFIFVASFALCFISSRAFAIESRYAVKGNATKSSSKEDVKKVGYTLANNNANLVADNKNYEDSDSNPYAVNNVIISGFADKTTEARSEAILEGQKKAFTQVLNNIDIEEGYSRFFTDEEMEKCVQSMQFDSEKFSKSSYYANMDIVFNKDFVKYYLKRLKITKDSPASKIYLVIPLYSQNDNLYIWEEQNIWSGYWTDVVDRKDIRSLRLSDGSIEDITLVNEDLLLHGKFAQFDELVEKYDVDTVILATSEFNTDTDALDITLKFLNKDSIETQELEMANTQNLEEKELTKVATYKMINYLLNDYDESQSLIKTKEKVIQCSAPFSKIKDWVNIREALTKNKEIENMQINEMRRRSVEFSIEYKDDLEKFLNDLENEGIYAKEKEGIYYFHSRRTFNLIR